MQSSLGLVNEESLMIDNLSINWPFGYLQKITIVAVDACIVAVG
jgi:hypothetical protein